MLGNGYLGLYLWGAGNVLRLTVGCAALWDHRGGLLWSARQNYPDIKAALEAKDVDRLKAIFAPTTPLDTNQPARPSIVPVGRIEVTLPDDAELLTTTADYATGLLTATYRRGEDERQAQVRLDMSDKGRFALQCPDIVTARVLSGYELSHPALANRGFDAPAVIDAASVTGFVQAMPVDDAYALCFSRQHQLLSCRFQRHEQPAVLSQLMQERTPGCDWETLATTNAAWWQHTWQRIPDISIDNPDLEAIYSEGMAKFAMMTADDGVAAGLQGPWFEDDALPPWSGDYHFNINVQMCYWPALRGNLCDNLRPLFDMIGTWRPQMRQTAKYFIGIDDGYMLPHSVDDRCVCMGDFWTGAIDLACGVWMAQMMYEYADYTGDAAFLQNLGFDFMQGVFNTMFAMLEWRDGQLTLPVSVSPEYRGAAMNAWGANASFQLAALHRLARDLQLAAQWLQTTPDARWQQVRDCLPQAALYNAPQAPELALWEGQHLEESHRHHSHLGAICPFDTIDPDDPQWQHIAKNSYHRWIRLGMGLWTGWCMPWAAMLHTRFNNGRMTETILEIWRRIFVNKGGGTLHDPAFTGLSVMGFGGHRDIMQMDATMGAVTAIQDLLLHARQNTIHLFGGTNPLWHHAAFSNMPAPGGFVVSASKPLRGTLNATVTATRKSSLKLVVHDARTLHAHLDGQTIASQNGVFACDLEAGQTLTVTSSQN